VPKIARGEEDEDDDDEDEPMDPQLQAILDDLHDSSSMFLEERSTSSASPASDEGASTAAFSPAAVFFGEAEAPISPPASDHSGFLDDFFAFDCKLDNQQEPLLSEALFNSDSDQPITWDDERSLGGLEDLFPMIGEGPL